LRVLGEVFQQGQAAVESEGHILYCETSFQYGTLIPAGPKNRALRPTVFVLNGPNLNLLGIREPHLYGSTTLAQVQQLCERVAGELALGCEFRQTNHEGVMVDWVQEARERAAAIVINPAGLSFRSIPLLDALKAVDQPIAEVHVTNIHRRDALYQHSLVSLAATGVICGFGAFGYELAIRALAQRLAVATAA
jgi:3-dehydroquinate dehydratase-2